MKSLVLVSALVAAVLARPDVSELSGYNYNRPGNLGVSSNNIPSGSYLPGSGSGSSILGSGIGGSGQYSGVFDGIGSVGGGGISGIGSAHNQNQVQDQKHVYFYAAPDDEAPARLRINVAPSSHKNTKIIFVKAPSYGGVIPEIIAPPSQAEDKTLVYVLVKKPEQVGAINIPSGLGVKQSKPEVFFIKYKTQQDAEQAVASGLNGQSVGSSLHDLGSQQSFIGSIKDTVNQGSGFGGIGGGLGGLSGGSFGGSSSFGGSGGLGGSISTNYGTPGASGPY